MVGKCQYHNQQRVRKKVCLCPSTLLKDSERKKKRGERKGTGYKYNIHNANNSKGEGWEGNSN